jgi:hypothetical protein
LYSSRWFRRIWYSNNKVQISIIMTSKIKVDNIENQCGGAVVTKCGGTTTISGSVVKSNAIQASDGGNLVSQSGTTITLGASGDTINLASGASQSGFGRTGTVDWITTPKTATFTAVSGEGYFCNTSGGAFTVNLPAGSANAIVSLADYAGTWQTNNLTVSPNGSEKIGGTNTYAVLSTEGQSVTFVYVDSTQGWINTMDSTSNVRGNAFVAATGGTETTSGDYKIHTFTGPGDFIVTAAGTPAGSDTVDYLVVAGGGAGGWANGGGGGGGAGGLRYSASTYSNPAPAPSAGSALPVSITTYPIIVGGGGTGISGSPDSQTGNPGSNSTFSTITSTGGGGGGGGSSGLTGGSGGGGGKGGPTYGSPGGAGNTPPVSPSQGSSGGHGGAPATGAPSPNYGGGGGGHSATGQDVTGTFGGDGGNGSVVAINGSCGAYGGGGGGQAEVQPAPLQGSGGSGGGGTAGQTGVDGSSGSTNTGGGGGGADSVPAGPVNSGNGGSGIVIIRYKFQ